MMVLFYGYIMVILMQLESFFNELHPSLKIEVEKGKGSYEQNLTHLCNFNIFR